ncbi:uncharacterized protein LOC124945978 [Impatiens glandulifera]|uniref:uncharacterized protein LOC124945978 n=1 Tax=Impatiens glandulifera TaxID=253017 RepID=UPI001FB0F92E|nr:uncharacterized protein LOC124945978 [Impatiens glandulifera]
MGKKLLDALLGRTSTFKSTKLKPLLNLALSRLSVLKNQRLSRRSNAHSDVVQLLSFPGHHHRALLRVEQVIKEDNMIDAFVMLEGYCFMILERINLLQQQRECPEELNEAVSCLLFAASRCGEFPELQEIRSIFTHGYGKEFAARAIELRNNCSVNRQMILKLSPRQPSLENRLKVLEEIAAENNVVLQIEDITDEKKQVVIVEQKPVMNNFEESDSIKMGKRRQYKDVVDAAQAAFESAAYAAEAARAAVELSKSGTHDYHHDDDDDDDNPGMDQTTRNMPVNKDGNEIENKYEITEVEEEIKEESIIETRKGQEALGHERTNGIENEIRFDESEEEGEDETNNEQIKAEVSEVTTTRDEEEDFVAMRGSLKEQDEKRYPVEVVVVDNSKESSSVVDSSKNKKEMETKPASVRTRRRRLWL